MRKTIEQKRLQIGLRKKYIKYLSTNSSRLLSRIRLNINHQQPDSSQLLNSGAVMTVIN